MSTTGKFPKTNITKVKKTPKKASSKPATKAAAATAGGSTKAITKRRKGKQTFATYIFKVLKQLHPDNGIGRRGMSQMNSLVNDIFTRVSTEACYLARINKRKTVKAREIQTAVRLVFPGELARHAVSEGTKAVTKYEYSSGDNRKDAKVSIKGKMRYKSISASTFAGLQFPVGRIRAQIRKTGGAQRVSMSAGVYLGAVLEYVSAEVLELASNACRAGKRTRINPRFINLAIRNDEELKKMFGGITIASGGVLPNIHAVLMPKKKMTTEGEGGSGKSHGKGGKHHGKGGKTHSK